MKKFAIEYVDQDGVIHEIIVEAFTHGEARRNFQRDYPNTVIKTVLHQVQFTPGMI